MFTEIHKGLSFIHFSEFKNVELSKKSEVIVSVDVDYYLK